MDSFDTRLQLAHWYISSRLGQTLLGVESAYLRDALRLCYGQHFLQIGFLGWERDFWEPDCFRRAWIVERLDPDFRIKAALAGIAAIPDNSRCIISWLGDLPIASNSVDLLLLPHVLEFETDPHQLLREAARVLKPGGQIHLLGFNPYGFLGMWRRITARRSNEAPVCGRFIASWRLLDWLSLLNFEAEVAASFSVSPLFHSFRLSGKGAMMARLCNVPFFATGYAIRAVKRTYRLIPIGKTLPLTARLAQQGMVGPSSTRDNLDG